VEPRHWPIGDYGLVGDTRCAALVAPDGRCDWLCIPRFDGEPVFGALVGGRDAGSFLVGPDSHATLVARRYRNDSATLETTWSAGGGSLTLTEGMVADLGHRLLPTTMFVRRLTARDRPVDAVVQFDPRLGERHLRPRVRRRDGGVVCQWGALALSLQSEPFVELDPGEPMVVTVTPETPVTFVVSVAEAEPLIELQPRAAWDALVADEQKWQRWCTTVDAAVPRRDLVVRSLITLRLLTHSPTGAPVAAPTTSLPEELHGIRNWDYRYAWPRDASIGIGAFLGVQRPDVAHRFMAWLLHASRLERPRLPVLLTLDGTRPPRERELEGWDGYCGSRPVRVGNAAAMQHQLDGYGWVVDAAWLLAQSGARLNGETWRAIKAFVRYVETHWHLPDAGIWESRAQPAHYVHSKLMGWLALDRGLRLAETYGLGRRRTQQWTAARAALAADIREHGFDADIGGYTRAYGSGDVDAALLVLPLLGFEPRNSPRTRATIDTVRRELDAGAPLLYRYRSADDGLRGGEGAFVACTFWLVQALATSGRLEEAVELFDAALALATPLGLYAEEIDPVTRQHLGNFPQALSHAAVVQAALAVRDASRRRVSETGQEMTGFRS
jgi:GH15 family glucan-1,4-alpha-glucosidase